MASAANVSAENRTQLGSRANKRLRDSGKLPGVIYGHKQAVLPITLPKKEVVNHLERGTHLFALQVDGMSYHRPALGLRFDLDPKSALKLEVARTKNTDRLIQQWAFGKDPAGL